MTTVAPSYLKGALFGFAAVSIWASWSVITRRAVMTSLDEWDIAALRFGVAGLLLSPVLVRRGLAYDRLGWLGLAAIIAGAGAPYALVAAAGLRFAPAYDAGAAWENLCLEGTGRGFVVHGMQGFDYEKAKELIPQGCEVLAMFAVGKRAPQSSLPQELREKEVPSGRKKISVFCFEGKVPK